MICHKKFFSIRNSHFVVHDKGVTKKVSTRCRARRPRKKDDEERTIVQLCLKLHFEYSELAIQTELHL
jgi:hypothetical protein